MVDTGVTYLVINNKYVLNRKLGSGSFGDIYLGIDKFLPKDDPNRKVAIKLEKRDAEQQLLKYESKVYEYLYEERKGVPKIHWYGVQDDYNIMVIELLGPNLEKLLVKCNRRFSLKTTLMLGMRMTKAIKYIHNKGVVHRDIKPENFLISFTGNDIYIIDFGLCKYFKDHKNRHIPYSQNKKLIGTMRYSSINSHKGYELSRRDDLESIGYILMYFYKGKLPWQNLGTKDLSKDEKYKLIYECKENTTLEQLCQGVPKEFKTYMEYVKSLEFSEKPNYTYIYELFLKLFKKNGFVDDDVYDWD